MWWNGVILAVEERLGHLRGVFGANEDFVLERFEPSVRVGRLEMERGQHEEVLIKDVVPDEPHEQGHDSKAFSSSFLTQTKDDG